jgi:hypothetical protein
MTKDGSFTLTFLAGLSFCRFPTLRWSLFWAFLLTQKLGQEFGLFSFPLETLILTDLVCSEVFEPLYLIFCGPREFIWLWTIMVWMYRRNTAPWRSADYMLEKVTILLYCPEMIVHRFTAPTHPSCGWVRRRFTYLRYGRELGSKSECREYLVTMLL